MADLPTPGSDYSTLRPRPLNFSRPRPRSLHSSSKLVHELPGDSTQHTISAFHEPNRALPDEPRFSIDSTQTDSTTSNNTINSAGSEFAWDGQLGILRSRSVSNYDQTRYSGSSRPTHTRSATSTTLSQSTNAGSDQPLLAELPGDSPPAVPRKLPKIVKRTSFDQQSERVSIDQSMGSSEGWEDTASHHTASVDGDGGEHQRDPKWKASDYDTSGLSVAEIHKLRKKGINPALYAEMKAARRGKSKWLGALHGNAYIG